MSKVFDVDGWDLNFWLNEDKGWVVQAYPYDDAGEWIGFHQLWLDVELTASEVAELKLGDPANEYVGGDTDFWAGADWIVAEYPHLSPSFMAKLAGLPKQIKIIDDELVKVGE
jgi:hypothetical protein